MAMWIVGRHPVTGKASPPLWRKSTPQNRGVKDIMWLYMKFAHSKYAWIYKSATVVNDGYCLRYKVFGITVAKAYMNG